MGSKDQIKHAIAAQAARIMALEGVHDFRAARKKAVQRLGFYERKNLPDEGDIVDALAEYHRLFHGDDQPIHLARLRELALEALNFFQDFSPRVVGGVWDGTAGKFSPILLHLYPATPEQVIHRLWEAGIPFEETVSVSSTEFSPLSILGFYLDGVRLELWIFATELGGSVNRKARAPGGALNQLEALIRSVERR